MTSSLHSSEDVDDSVCLPDSVVRAGHFEPFAICHSERSEESISDAQDKFREESRYYSVRLVPTLDFGRAQSRSSVGTRMIRHRIYEKEHSGD
jgi:hypothetical protein